MESICRSCCRPVVEGSDSADVAIERDSGAVAHVGCYLTARRCTEIARAFSDYGPARIIIVEIAGMQCDQDARDFLASLKIIPSN